jgi:DNA-binding response OmpR family regulator
MQPAVPWGVRAMEQPMAAKTPPDHVVVIDDEPSLLQLYQDVLVDEGYRVTLLERLAEDPSEVLRLVPSLIVLDLVYRGDPIGLPFLYRLRADPVGSNVPVLVSSAAASLLNEHEAELRGLDAATLAKPFDIEVLLRSARDLCARATDARARSFAAVERMRLAAARAWSPYEPPSKTV